MVNVDVLNRVRAAPQRAEQLTGDLQKSRTGYRLGQLKLFMATRVFENLYLITALEATETYFKVVCS